MPDQKLPVTEFDASRPDVARVYDYLVGEAGIRQLLDIGSGLPAAENVREIARRVKP